MIALLRGQGSAARFGVLGAVLGLAVAGLAGACAGAPESQRADEAVRTAGPSSPPHDFMREPRPPARALVTVVDADSGRAIRGAVVQWAGEVARSDEHGRAWLPAAGRVRVRATARGYGGRVERVSLGRSRQQVGLYRPQLQWPAYGADPARTQAHPAIRLRPPFRVVWRRWFGSLLEFPAAVWEGVAYVNTFQRGLYAISMRNGELLWRRDVGSRAAASPTVVPDRRELLVVTMIPGDFQVRDLDSGKLKWRYRTGLTEPTPVVRGRIAYFAATNGNVYAMDLQRRRPRWVASTGAKITSSPALSGNRLYVGDYAGRVFAFDARNGRRIWTGSAGSRVYGTVAVAGGRVFAPSVFSGLSALSAGTGRLLWRIPVGVYLYSSPAVYRGRVYFGTYAGRVYCVSASSGRILWTASAGGAVSGAVQVVGGVVYAGSFGDRITAWHWRTGRELWRFPHGRYVPVSGNGARLLMHGLSAIWAVEPRGRRR